LSDLRVVRAEGSPGARGRHIGRELAEPIQRSIDFYHRYLDRRGITSPHLQDLLAPYLAAAETHLPACAETIKGMAEGAMVPVWELFAVNAFEELEPLLEQPEGRMRFLQRDAGASRPRLVEPDRCSSFTVSGPGFTLLGHNEQWLAGDAGNVAVVIDVPEDPRSEGGMIASPTVVCCLPAVGMNRHGYAQGIQSLVAADDGIGVPRVLVSRHALAASDRADALRRTAFEPRAGGYGYAVAFSGGNVFTIETTAGRQGVIEGAGPHTNHYLDPELAGFGPQPSPGSSSRYQRMCELIADRRPDSPDSVMEVLRDHASAPQAICLHPDEAEGDEAAAVVFSVVCDLESGGRMWVAPGNPCQTPYEEIDLRGAR
jgi:isopenicillin-N N-acyltransferase-like protein